MPGCSGGGGGLGRSCTTLYQRVALSSHGTACHSPQRIQDGVVRILLNADEVRRNAIRVRSGRDEPSTKGAQVPRRSVNLRGHEAERFTAGMRAIADELKVPDEFPAEVLAAAEDAAKGPAMPEGTGQTFRS